MITTKIQLRFSDFDMGGHVHNAAYLNYFESARIGFFMVGFGQDWDWKKDGLIIKKNTIEYHIPTFIEEKIHVEVACNNIGSKSFTLTYSVLDAKNKLKAYGESVVVSFDYKQQKTISIPANMRKLLEEHLID
ncbi:MAG: acyl-CoA thioester hydrolase [Crocinitomix sp.]|jgi:acyl-CoA thioester hydrolase